MLYWNQWNEIKWDLIKLLWELKLKKNCETKKRRDKKKTKENCDFWLCVCLESRFWISNQLIQSKWTNWI